MKGNLTLRDPTNMAMRINSFQTSECWSDCGQDFQKILQSCSRIFWDLLSLWGNISTPLNLISAVELPPAVHSRNFPLQLSSSVRILNVFFNRSNLDMVPKPRSARFHGNVCAFSPWLMHGNKRVQIAHSVPSPLRRACWLCCCTTELCRQLIAWEISRRFYIISAPDHIFKIKQILQRWKQPRRFRSGIIYSLTVNDNND